MAVQVKGKKLEADSTASQKQASQHSRSLIEASLDPLVTISPKGEATDVDQGSGRPATLSGGNSIRCLNG